MEAHSDWTTEHTFHRNRVTPKAQSSESGGRETEKIRGIGGRHVSAGARFGPDL